MEEGTFYGLTMKTPVIYAEIQVLLMFSILDAGFNDVPRIVREIYKRPLIY